MPVVAEPAAPILLQQALAHSPSEVGDDSLRKRCIRALAPDWKALLQPHENGAPAPKRQRISEVGSSIQMNNAEMPLEVKLELAMTALFNGENAIADANLRAEENAKRAEEEKTRADGEKKRADEEKRRADTEKLRADTEKFRADDAERRRISLSSRLALADYLADWLCPCAGWYQCEARTYLPNFVLHI